MHSNEEITAAIWKLSSRSREQLGIGHIEYLMQREDGLGVIRWKLGEPGRTTVPEAYEELLAVLEEES
jgi:hypothetical protein